MHIQDKVNLHPSSLHRKGYDFKHLSNINPKLKQYIRLGINQELSIDFSNPNSVRELNKSLLLGYYNIKFWDIPSGYLCPPVPGRADYILNLADLLAEQIVPTSISKKISILDIGVGANCIYPIIGNALFGWTFTGVDVDTAALASAQKIINGNENLIDDISLRLQTNPDAILEGIINPNDHFDAVICNPPFHASALEVIKSAETKWRKLGYSKAPKDKFNFAGVPNELFYKGGEIGFLKKYIQESIDYKNSILWFTSIVSQKENYLVIKKYLERINPVDIRTIEMSQGQKKTRVLAWSFLSKEEQLSWKNKYFL